MSQDLPYWFKVLKHFEQKRYIQNGLTIPFLIGSRSIIEPSQPLQSISEFINDLIEGTEATKVTIMTCNDIKEYILALLDSDSVPYLSSYKALGNLICTDDSIDAEPSALVELIDEKYSSIIENATYSKNNGRWDEYTSIEVSQLSEITNS